MNKKLMAVAVASVLAMPLAVNAAGKTKVYGSVHLSVDKPDETEVNVNGSARKANKLGMKGSMDTNIADFKAIFQIEVGMAVGANTGLDKERDTWAGLSSKSMGTLRVGTMATHYKQSSKMTDALFTTSLEGRGVMATQSAKYAAGFGAARGRANQMIRYDSPSIAGVKAIGHYQMVNKSDNNLGVALQYKTKKYLAYFDYMDLKSTDKVAMKVGGKAKFGPASLSLQYEIDDDGSLDTKTTKGVGNLLHVQGTYSMGPTMLVLTVGNNDENTAYGVAVSQKVAKKIRAYVGYGANGSGDDDSTVISVGMQAKFGK